MDTETKRPSLQTLIRSFGPLRDYRDTPADLDIDLKDPFLPKLCEVDLTLAGLVAAVERNAEADALLIMDQIERLTRALDLTAEYRPFLQYDEVIANGNILDRQIEAQITRFMNEYETINVSDLEEEREGRRGQTIQAHDLEKWERLDPGSTRYEVREVLNEEIDPDHVLDIDPDEMSGEKNELPNEFIIWDTERDYEVDRFPDEDDANSECQQMNREDGDENLAGFPFAQNTGYLIERYEVDYFAEAGFCVYDYDSGDKIIAGIDGGGYDFLSAHWAKLWWAKMRRWGNTVQTEKGPRRVEKISDETNG